MTPINTANRLIQLALNKLPTTSDAEKINFPLRNQSVLLALNTAKECYNVATSFDYDMCCIADKKHNKKYWSEVIVILESKLNIGSKH